MPPTQKPKSFLHFSKHLFVVSRVHAERRRAKEDVDSHLQNMKKSIIKMRLSYTDIDRLVEKIDALIRCERKYVKLFKPDDEETKMLKEQVKATENELKKEREEKQVIISENNEKINQLTESLKNIKGKMNELLVEKAKRHQRLTALDKKIREKVDVHKYYRP